MAGCIKMYQWTTTVFTNDGQTDVKGFGPKLARAAGHIRMAGRVDVYVGYHGKVTGEWDRNFTDVEWGLVEMMKTALKFTEATLIDIRLRDGGGMSDKDIVDAAKAGNCFFTWCDSDKKVPGILKLASGRSLI